MNYKELQQAAKEVGAVIDVLMLGRHDNTVFTTGELECFAAAIEKRTIERCESVLMQLHKKHRRNHNHFHYAALQVAAIRKLGEQE